MKKISLFLVLFSLFTISTLVFTNCKKDNETDDPTTPVVPTTTTTISGIVVDLNNNPIQGVSVMLEGSTIAPKTTTQYGSFYFHKVSTSNRISLTFSKDSYLKVTRSETRPSSGVVIIHAMLIPKNSDISTTSMVNGSIGGNISLPSANTQVIFPANSLVDANGNAFTGNAEISLAYLDPSAENFNKLIPGGDMLALNSSSTNGLLYSFGIIKVEMTDGNGNALQLKNETSSKATIEVGVPITMQADAPTTIPLWYFDASKGKWVEEGVATLNNGKYVGQVAHFTDWNCDVWSETQATVTGTVTDMSGNPVAGVSMKTGQSWAVTNNLGVYTRNVPSGVAINVSVNNYYGHSETKSAGVLSAGQTATVNFQVPQMNYVRGRLLNCSQSLIGGTVGISWGSRSSAVSVTSGYFNIPVATDASSLTLWAYNGTAYVSQSIYPIFENNIDTINDVFLCDIATGPNQFTIDGGGFSNQTFNNFSITKTGQYSEFNEMGQIFKTTNITLEGEDGTFNLSFYDNVTGTYTSNCYGSFSQIGGTNLYFSFTNMTMTVTKYGNVGQLIEGTFSGDGTNDNGAFTITNGKFSVIRMPNQYHNQGFKKYLKSLKSKNRKR